MPDSTITERLRGLLLSAAELKNMTDWPGALIEDYLTLFENFVLLGEGIEMTLTYEDVLGTANQVIVTLNADKTITISISDNYLPTYVLETLKQVLVADNGDGTITLSLPQNIDTDADVEFDSVTLDDLTASRLVSSDASKKLASIANLASWIAGTVNQITVTDDGDGTITLSLPQNIDTSADVEFDSLILDDLTALFPVWTDANKKLISKAITPCAVVRTFLVPTTQTVTTGTLTSGTVSDIQAWQDGNEVEIAEVTGVPGFNVEYLFENVADFCEVLVSFYYVGSATHDCIIQIYDDTNSSWKEFFSQSGASLSHNTRFSPLPVSSSDFINASNEVKIRFYHPQSGNASHDLYIDYVSIIGVAV